VTVRRGVLVAVPLLLILAGLVLVPLAALTDFGPERYLKEQLGLVEPGCNPRTAESAGWREEDSLPEARDELRAVEVDGDAYIAGGTIALLEYGEPSNVPGVRERVVAESIANLTRFVPETGTYKELPRMPAALNHIGMAVYGDHIYVVGGHGDVLNGADARRSFFRYSPRARRWSRMPPMPTPRGAVAVGVIDDRLYVAGGMLRGSPLRTLEAFDFGSRRWEALPSMPTGREHIAGAAANGDFYVIGGRNRLTDALSEVSRYDPDQGEWESLPNLPTPSGGLEAISVGDRVIAMGGGNDRGGTVTGAVQLFDPKTDTWRQLPEMRTPRHGFGAALLGDRVYAFGGSPCALFAKSDIVESFDATRAREAP
jgi:non-specific serine/threonine protein kinase